MMIQYSLTGAQYVKLNMMYPDIHEKFVEESMIQWCKNTLGDDQFQYMFISNLKKNHILKFL